MGRYAVAALIVAVVTVATPAAVSAQSDYGIRIPSRSGQWLAPVASRLIGSNDDDHIGRRSVNSWDWTAALGSPVFSVGDGVVEYAGCQLSAAHGYGCWLMIDLGNGYQSSHAHCMENSIRVQAGDRVDAWTQICSIGMTGKTSWPHVHLVIKKDGVHQRLDSIFDPALTRYCKFCPATNQPGDPILRDSVAKPVEQPAAERQVTQQTETRTVMLLAAILYRLGDTPPALLGVGMALVLGLLLFCGKTARAAVLGAGLTTLVVGLGIQTEMPVRGQQVLPATAPQVAEVQQVINVDLPADWAGNKDASDIAKLWGRHRDLIAKLSEETQIPMSAIVGTLMTESRGVGVVNGRMKIRLETHQFQKFLANNALFEKYFRVPCCGKARFLQASYWNGSTWADVHAGQDNEWAAFQIAASLNEDAAYRALSMGAPQIFGDNYKMFGYGSAKEMFENMSKGEHIQIVNMFKYIAEVNHLGSLRSGNYEAFVANYNGPGNVPVYTGLVRKYEAVFKQMVAAGVLQ
ncbi:MAG: N-acetylmuramidase domain-containing protein [Caldilineaceae bacterium]|jgi:hypothetical protein